MTASKRCPRCGQVKPAEAFYRRRGWQLSSYCQPCTRAASQESRRSRRQDPTTAAQLRVVDRARQRRHRTLDARGGGGR
jgi:hypothetical protein